MNQEQFTAAVRPSARVLIAALVPAKGDEDHPLVAAVPQAVEATGAVVVGSLTLRRGVSRAKRPGGSKKFRAPLSAVTFIGRGKAAELAVLAAHTQAEVIVFCNPLTGTQRRNLEQITSAIVVSHTFRVFVRRLLTSKR